MPMRPILIALVALLIFPLLVVAAHLTRAPPPLEWQAPLLVASDRAERGPWQQNDSRYDYVDDPTVKLDEYGRAAVAWVEQGSKDVWFQRFEPDGQKQTEKPVNVSRSPATFSWLPRIVVAPDITQNVFVLWQEIIFSGGSHGGEIMLARSQDGGRTFARPVNLSNSKSGDGKGRINQTVWHNGSYDIVSGTNGLLCVVWSDSDGMLWSSRSMDGGVNFSRPIQLAGGSQSRPARAPSMALGPDQTLYLAWTNGNDPGAGIQVAKSTDGGATFSASQVAVQGKGYADAPQLAVDADSVLHLVYGQSEAGPFDRYHVAYTRSADGMRSFSVPHLISGSGATPDGGANFPAIGIDVRGTLYVTWELFPDPKQWPRGLGIAVSSDGGTSFSAPAVVPDSLTPGDGANGSLQGLLMQKLSVNSAGRLAIVNSSFRKDDASRIWLMRAMKK